MARLYTPRGSTRKPCPGCGGVELRPTHGVCGSCLAKLKEVDQRAADAAKKGDQTLRPFFTFDVAQALPYPHHAGDHETALQKAFFNLSGQVSSPSKTRPEGDFDDNCVWPPNDRSAYVRAVSREFAPGTALALREAYRIVLLALHAAYAEGHRDGRNLLGQLASGAITRDKFNETTIGRESGR